MSFLKKLIGMKLIQPFLHQNNFKKLKSIKYNKIKGYGSNNVQTWKLISHGVSMPSFPMILWSRRTSRDSAIVKHFFRFYSSSDSGKKAPKLKSFSIYRYVSQQSKYFTLQPLIISILLSSPFRTQKKPPPSLISKLTRLI